MARKRMIDPAIWADEDFGTMPAEDQVFFIGLFSNADDEGRLPGNALYLASVIFPYKGLTKEQATKIRDRVLKTMRSAILYEVDGKEYIQLKKWLIYQSINKPSQSNYPPLPEDYGSSTVALPPNRIEKNRIEKKESVRENKLTELIEWWNKNLNSKHEPSPKLQTNFDYWSKIYSLDQIKMAAKLGKTQDSWWSDKITPTKLLRTKSQSGDACDHIGDLLNKYRSLHDL